MKRVLMSIVAFMAAPAAADVVMPPPPHHGEISLGLQQEINRRFGGDLNQRLHLSLAGIAVSGGYAGSAGKAPVTVLIRDQLGWKSWQSGRPRSVPAALGAELDRLLSLPAFWSEEGFVYGQPCPGKGRVMLAFRLGHDKLSRQPCGPVGLAGRLADLAATERLPATAPRTPPPPVQSEREAEEVVLHLARQSAAAWNQGNLDLHLEPYAESVAIVRPTGTILGKSALRQSARTARRWSVPADPQLVIQAQTIRRTAPDTLVHKGQYQWHGGPRAALEYREFWATTTWRKLGSKWEIAREEIGPEVTIKWPA